MDIVDIFVFLTLAYFFGAPVYFYIMARGVRLGREQMKEEMRERDE